MCEDCRAQNLERKRAQFDEPVARPIKRGGYESRSKKVWLDRFEAARKWLKRNVERYQEGRARGYEDSWFYSKVRRNDWVAQKYRKARAEAQKHGALPPA